MNANDMNGLVPLALLFGAVGILAACGSSQTNSTETAGSAGSGGASASGGNAGLAAAGSNCAVGAAVTPVISTGAGGATDILCYPDIVCFAPAVATPGLSFVNSAFAHMGASSAGHPFAANESGVPTAKVSYPEPGKVCMSGDDGAQLELYLGNGVIWDGVNIPDPDRGPGLFHAGARGIKAMSFTIETPPSTGISLWILSFPPPCGSFVGADAEQDGNPVVITSSGTATTLSFATDFTLAFDTNAIDGVNFVVGRGTYDYCITNLRFLDANGGEVTP